VLEECFKFFILYMGIWAIFKICVVTFPPSGFNGTFRLKYLPFQLRSILFNLRDVDID
jgi:hypothetical protein